MRHTIWCNVPSLRIYVFALLCICRIYVLHVKGFDPFGQALRWIYTGVFLYIESKFNNLMDAYSFNIMLHHIYITHIYGRIYHLLTLTTWVVDYVCSIIVVTIFV